MTETEPPENDGISVDCQPASELVGVVQSSTVPFIKFLLCASKQSHCAVMQRWANTDFRPNVRLGFGWQRVNIRPNFGAILSPMC